MTETSTVDGDIDLRPKDTLLDKVINVGMWGLGVSWLAPMVTMMTALYQFVPSWKTETLTRIYIRGQLAATGSKWQSVAHPSIDPKRQYIFATNHVNHFDFVTMYNCTPHFKQGLELESHFKYPFYGWFMKARGTVPVRKGVKGQTSDLAERIKAEMDDGRSILAFPEGHRTRNGRVGPFRRGIFYIARDIGAPIIPVAVTGMYEVMYRGSLMIRPGYTVTVFCEEPVEMAGLSDAEVEEVTNKVQSVISRRVDDYWRGKGFNIPR